MTEKKKTFNFSSDWNFSDDDKVEGGNFFKFENENDFCVGVLKQITEGNFGKEYLFESPNGEIFSVGSYSALTSKIEDADVGKRIKIEYKGEIKSKTGRIYKDFEVYKK